MSPKTKNISLKEKMTQRLVIMTDKIREFGGFVSLVRKCHKMP